jgi:hypothetical protein
MTDFPLYDVANTCRECGTEYPAKAFLPQGTEPRFGLCPPCMALDDERQAKLRQPPKNHGTPDRRAQEDRRVPDFRRRAAGERD